MNQNTQHSRVASIGFLSFVLCNNLTDSFAWWGIQLSFKRLFKFKPEVGLLVKWLETHERKPLEDKSECELEEVII